MCRGKNHGNRRCPNDTSRSRQHRRIAAKIRAGYSDPNSVNPAPSSLSPHPTEPLDVNTVKRDLELLRGNPSASDVDIAAMGAKVATLIDSLIASKGVTSQDVSQGLYVARAQELYAESRAILHEVSEARRRTIGSSLGTENAERKLMAKYGQVAAAAKALELERREAFERTQRIVSDSTREVLALLRPFGGRLSNLTESSNRAAAATVRSAIQDLPTDWIEQSNRHGQMTVKHAVTRSYYRPDFHITTVRLPVTVQETRPSNWEPTIEDIRDGGYSLAVVNNGSNVWNRYEFEVSDGSQRPSGNRWKEFDNGSGTSWRRVSLRETSQAQSGGELFIPRESGAVSRESVSVHEFMHRMEDVNPRLAELSHLHHERRTTVNGEPQKPERYLESEYVQPNHYAHRYMGKIETFGADGKPRFTEVLSNSVQALFHGNHGGLIGLGGRHPADPASRAFALGVLTSC